MSQENVELAYRAYDAFNRRDWDAFLALMDEDIDVESRLVAMEAGITVTRACGAGGTTSSGPFRTTPLRLRNCATSET
jgi:ketosteroid isomerase-like protein